MGFPGCGGLLRLRVYPVPSALISMLKNAESCGTGGRLSPAISAKPSSARFPLTYPPPSIVRIVPDVYPDFGLARNATALPVSVGVASHASRVPLLSLRQRSAPLRSFGA